jgi:peroxiredoxin Q/BCP
MTALNTGDKAPDFRLQDQDERLVQLSDYQGEKLLLYFYPKANTPGCTKQACFVRDALSELKEHGVQAVGISPDKPSAQSKFYQKFGLGFPLLSDQDHVVAEAYGAWGEKSMYGKKYMGIVRSAFLIDENGSIQHAWYKVSPKDTVPNVKQALGID